MSVAGVNYTFKGAVRQYQGSGAWVFVAMPENMAAEIRSLFKREEEGWGRLKVTASIGDTVWKTAIWFDKKANTYLLPVKAEVRKAENIRNEASLDIAIWI